MRMGTAEVAGQAGGVDFGGADLILNFLAHPPTPFPSQIYCSKIASMGSRSSIGGQKSYSEVSCPSDYPPSLGAMHLPAVWLHCGQWWAISLSLKTLDGYAGKHSGCICSRAFSMM